MKVYCCFLVFDYGATWVLEKVVKSLESAEKWKANNCENDPIPNRYRYKEMKLED